MKLLALLMLLIWQMEAHAAPGTQSSKSPFETKKKGEVIDLVKETGELQMLTEKAVQVDKKTSDLSLGVSLGSYSPKQLAIETKGEITNYQFEKSLGVVQMQFQHFPLRALGKFGYAAKLGYFEHQQSTDFSTRLHVIPAELGVLYKYEFSGAEVVSPVVGLTYSKFLIFQRGVDQKNTSEQSGAQSYLIGANFNLNQIGIMRNLRNQWDLNLSYQNFYSVENPEMNWRGSLISAGLSMNL